MSLHRLILLVLLFPSAAMCAWTEPKALTNTSGSALNGCMVVSDYGEIYFFWDDNRNGSGQIFFRKRPCSEITFGSAQALSPVTSQARNPGASCGKIIVAVWEDDRNGTWQIFWRKSTDAGLSWTREQSLSSASAASFHPAVATSGDGIYVAWVDSVSGTIRFRSSSDAGISWTSEETLNNTGVDYPAMASAADNVYLVFQEDMGGSTEIVYRSRNSLNAWSGSFILSGTNVSRPAISAGENSVNVAWLQDNRVSARCSSNQGNAWQSEQTISGNISGTASSESITTGKSGKVYIAWLDNRDGSNKVYMTETSGENVWSQVRMICDSSSISFVSIGIFGFNLHLCIKSQDQFFYRMCDETSPVITMLASPTHPDGKSAGNNDPVFRWQAQDDSGGCGIAGYNYCFDMSAGTIPAQQMIYPPDFSEADFPGTASGTWYFHVRAVDNLGNWSAPAVFKVEIQNECLLPSEQVWCQPNPVRNDFPCIHYFLRKGASVAIEFFNEAGEKITEFQEHGKAGINIFTGLNAGSWVNGAYLFRVKADDSETGENAETVKTMVLVR